MECEICEEKSAKFLCKTCSGHLCEKCKSDHEKTKMFKNHEVVPSQTNEDLVAVLHCTYHTKKKLECFCDKCEKPVCTECMVLSHNGHCVRSLSEVYREIRNNKLKQIEKIENELLPKYKEILANESIKLSALTTKSAEIEQTILTHTQSLIKMIEVISFQTIHNLKLEEKGGLQEIDYFKESISKNINALEQISKALNAEAQGNPDVSFFESKRKYELEHYQVLPIPPASHYILGDFCPGNLSKEVVEYGFGIVPKLKRVGGNDQDKSQHQRFSSARDLDLQDVPCLEEGNTSSDEEDENASDFIHGITYEDDKNVDECKTGDNANEISVLDDSSNSVKEDFIKVHRSKKRKERRQQLKFEYQYLRARSYQDTETMNSNSECDDLIFQPEYYQGDDRLRRDKRTREKTKMKEKYMRKITS